MIDRERPRQSRKPFHIGKGEFDTLWVEPAGDGNAAPEGAHHPLVQQWQQRCAEPLEDGETQRIRADIDNRDAAIGGDRRTIRHRHQGYATGRVIGRPAAAGLAGGPCRAPTGWDWS